MEGGDDDQQLAGGGEPEREVECQGFFCLVAYLSMVSAWLSMHCEDMTVPALLVATKRAPGMTLFSVAVRNASSRVFQDIFELVV